MPVAVATYFPTHAISCKRTLVNWKPVHCTSSLLKPQYKRILLPQIHVHVDEAHAHTKIFCVPTQKESENALLFIILRQYQFSIHWKFPRVGTICTCESVACFKLNKNFKYTKLLKIRTGNKLRLEKLQRYSNCI